VNTFWDTVDANCTPWTLATLHPNRCRANVARIRQSRPDSGLGCQVKVREPFQVVPSSLGSGETCWGAVASRDQRQTQVPTLLTHGDISLSLSLSFSLCLSRCLSLCLSVCLSLRLSPIPVGAPSLQIVLRGPRADSKCAAVPRRARIQGS